MLDNIFKYEVNGGLNPANGTRTTDTYRYAWINDLHLALPTVGGLPSTPYGPAGLSPYGGYAYQPGTAVGSATPANGSNAENATYNDLLAVWDAYNGTGSEGGTDGGPPGWPRWGYWSATPSSSGHAEFWPMDGHSRANFNNGKYFYVVLQVL